MAKLRILENDMLLKKIRRQLRICIGIRHWEGGEKKKANSILSKSSVAISKKIALNYLEYNLQAFLANVILIRQIVQVKT